MPAVGAHNRGLTLAVFALLALIAAGTRLPAPWRTDVTNDEMYHIKSWRHQYRTNNVMPLFLRRLEQTNRLSSPQKETLRQLYLTSPLFQRLLCVKSEYGAYGYGALAEVIEAVSHSSITALRVPSVLFSLGTLVLAYFLGKALADAALGLWSSALFAIALLPQVYAGIGRVHGLTQFALVAVIYMYVRETQCGHRAPWRFLTVALLAQTAHATGWPVIGVFVASELVRRYLAGTSLRELVRQTWWYAAASLALLGLIATGMFDTSMIGANVYYPGVNTWWTNLCVASPFGHLAAFGPFWMWASGVAWIVLIAAGVRALVAGEWAARSFRWPFLAALAVSLVMPLVGGSGVRHMMIYGVMPMIIAALGARSLFHGARAALIGVAGVLVVFTAISLACRDCAYRFVLTGDIRYSEVAGLLSHALEPGDVWVSWPYFAACPLYPYARLPDPIMPISGEEFLSALHRRPRDRSCFVWMNRVDEDKDPVLKESQHLMEYPNGMELLKIAPISSP
jgi:hypothetical protein